MNNNDNSETPIKMSVLPTLPKPEKPVNKPKSKYPSLEEIISEPLYNIVNSILSYNITHSKIFPCSNKYKNLESLITKPNNLEFIIEWMETKNFKKWYCSFNEILTNLYKGIAKKKNIT